MPGRARYNPPDPATERRVRILFIGNSRIGDFILASGLIAHLLDRHPEARLTVVCGRICVPLLKETPRVERAIVLTKRSFHRHWLDLWKEVVGTRWDLVVDLRDTAVSRLLRAGAVRRLRRSGDRGHRVEEVGRVLALDPPPAPRLWLGERQRGAARDLVPDGPPVLAIGPGSTHRHKQWAPERFAELALRLTGPNGPLPGARVAALGSPDERPAAEPLLAAIPPGRRLDLMDKVPILEAAAVIERAALYVGNDNGQMHLAAATGTPTLGLFGPTPAHHYRPWGANAGFVQADEPYETLAARLKAEGEGTRSLMDGLSVDAVEAAATSLLARLR
jgi:lipopolysaccharide export system permease protein